MYLKQQISLFFYFMEVVTLQHLEINNTRRSERISNGQIRIPCAFLPILTWMWADEEVTLASPGFPKIYPPNMDCGWKLRTNKPHVTYHVKCSSFFVGRRKRQRRCNNRVDRLVLNNGLKTRKLCGHKSDIEIVSDGNILDLRFFSTRRRSYSGFLCSVLANTNSTTGK